MHKWKIYFCLHDEKFNLWSIVISSCIGHVQLMHWQKIPIQFPEVQIGCVLNQFSTLVEWYILAAINYETIYLTFKIIGHILWQDKSQKSDQFSKKMLPVTMMTLKWNYSQDLTPPMWRERGRPISTSRVSKGCRRRDASQLWLWTQTHRYTHTYQHKDTQTQRHRDTKTHRQAPPHTQSVQRLSTEERRRGMMRLNSGSLTWSLPTNWSTSSHSVSPSLL